MAMNPYTLPWNSKTKERQVPSIQDTALLGLETAVRDAIKIAKLMGASDDVIREHFAHWQEWIVEGVSNHE